MRFKCKPNSLRIHALPRRQLIVDFDAGQVTSDGGSPLLAFADQKLKLLDRLALAFDDHRDPSKTEHSVRQLLAQRIFALALSYEDLNDHDELSKDPLLAALVGKSDPNGQDRKRERDKGRAMATRSTLNRLELSAEGNPEADRYHKIFHDPKGIEQLLLDLFFEAHPKPPKEIVLDFDLTDDPLHGRQEGRFFHGYYGHYCYLPLYVFCGEHLLVAKLRTADGDPMRGVLDEMKRVVKAIRQRWPSVRITIRADSGFCREETMS